LVHVSLVGSEKAASIYDALPLPYDEELIDAEQKEMEEVIDEAKVIYDYARASGYFNTPIKGIA
jgi:uncharacterized protein (UPF0276 family)